MQQLTCFLGLWVFIGVAWCVSSNRSRFPVRIVVGGLLLQFGLAFLVLGTKPGRKIFELIGAGFTTVMESVSAGSGFLFQVGNENFDQPILMTFAFGVLPTVIFFSSLMSILYHLGGMQRLRSACLQSELH